VSINPLKARRKLASSIVLLLVIVAAFSVLIYYSYEKRYQGPLVKLTGVQSDEWISTSQITTPKTPIALGGFPFNTKNQPITIQSIALSNVPSGLKVGNSGMLRDSLFFILPKPWFKKLDSRPIQPLPMTVKPNNNNWFPVIWVTPMKKGTYDINGLIITYTIENRQYQDYFRDQFVICAGNGSSTCKEPNPPPVSPSPH
jgi:hypothetical protein